MVCDMTDTESSSPIAEHGLEAVLQEAWRLVRAEPGLAAYQPAGEHLERALTFRLGVHLDHLIAAQRRQWATPWNELAVDSELHRAHDGPKLGSTQAPDLIIHVRGTDDWNLLVVEAKHASRPNENDLERLQRLQADRGYRFAWAICLDLSGPLTITRTESVSNGEVGRVSKRNEAR